MSSEILIVGAGIFGISAALELRTRGYSVAVIDPGPIPHPLAESTDISKIVRRTYGSDEDYTALAEEAITGWLRWNDLMGEELFHQVGVAFLTRHMMQPNSFEGQSYRLALQRGTTMQRLDGQQIAQRYPAFAESASDGMLIPEDGYAESGRVVARLAQHAAEQGITLHAGQAAASLIEEGGRVIGVRTAARESFYADHVLIAAGAWTPVLVPEIASSMRATGHPVFHLKPADATLFDSACFPVFGHDISTTGWYGFPLHPREGVVKIAHHGAGRLRHPVLDERAVIAEEEAELRQFLAATLPMLADAPIVYTRLCLYCDTLDEHFWIDRSPTRTGLSVAAGGSGHAFKFGPVLGGLIADAVEDKPNPYRYKFRWRDLAPDTQGTEGARFHE